MASAEAGALAAAEPTTDYALWLALNAAAPSARDIIDTYFMSEPSEEDEQGVTVLRDVVGNPFRPAAPLDPAWRTPDVLALAQAAYGERALPAGALEAERLALPADALEEAGGDNAELLRHLRSAGPHVRGCWALDLVLGNE